MKEFDFEKIPIVEIANTILLDGVKKGASDIHFDPEKETLKIRMRVDGILYDYSVIPGNYKKNIVSRIKMIAGMNIMETRLPQDGAIKSKIGDKMLDLRVSSLPTNCGEKVVLRILDYSKSNQGLDSLGFSKMNYEKILKMVDIPNGIILVTGATGSGKSTTVYSLLQKLNTPEVNIITVEDPVEMDVAGINQVQAQQEIGLDFASVLRSILRQDPDIIMIGEIRDGETAKIAVRASITGHKVLSTIHTNSALNTIERLTDMEVERYLIGTSLNGVISQKLARRICPKCRVLRDTTEYEKNLFRRVLRKNIEKIYDINKNGCEHCFKGYKGRICVAEVLLISDEVRTAITNSAPKSEMRKLVYGKCETHTLLEDGLEKVFEGETSFNEIMKIADLENDLAIHDQENIDENFDINTAPTVAINTEPVAQAEVTTEEKPATESAIQTDDTQEEAKTATPTVVPTPVTKPADPVVATTPAVTAAPTVVPTPVAKPATPVVATTPAVTAAPTVVPTPVAKPATPVVATTPAVAAAPTVVPTPVAKPADPVVATTPAVTATPTVVPTPVAKPATPVVPVANTAKPVLAVAAPSAPAAPVAPTTNTISQAAVPVIPNTPTLTVIN